MRWTAAAAVQTAGRASDTAGALASSLVLSAAPSARHCVAVAATPAAAASTSSQQSPVALSDDCAPSSAQPAASIKTTQHHSTGVNSGKDKDDVTPQCFISGCKQWALLTFAVFHMLNIGMNNGF